MDLSQNEIKSLHRVDQQYQRIGAGCGGHEKMQKNMAEQCSSKLRGLSGKYQGIKHELFQVY
jgi:hypothetical protein